ncbi:MAG: hypothetical protein ABIE47_11475 [Pseudomonadota bacterium]|nr:hypothetical protein [Pseudomonadota bacterium]
MKYFYDKFETYTWQYISDTHSHSTQAEVIVDIPPATEFRIHITRFPSGAGADPHTHEWEKLREATKKTAEDKAFNEMIEKPGDEVYYLHGDEVMKHIQKEAKTISEIDQELVKEAPKK